MTGHSEQLYSDLRRMAASFMRRERRGHTLQPTELANEVFLHVGKPSERWDSTAHYFGAAARAMRQILVQYSRRRGAEKRGGAAARVTMDDLQLASPESPAWNGCDLEQALTALGEHDASLLRLVELRYYSGHTLEEIATETGRSLASVNRDWKYTRAWLFRYLTH